MIKSSSKKFFTQYLRPICESYLPTDLSDTHYALFQIDWFIILGWKVDFSLTIISLKNSILLYICFNIKLDPHGTSYALSFYGKITRHPQYYKKCAFVIERKYYLITSLKKH